MLLYDVFESFGSFAEWLNYFVLFLFTPINDFFAINVPIIGTFTGSELFLGSGIVLILGGWLISAIIPN